MIGRVSSPLRVVAVLVFAAALLCCERAAAQEDGPREPRAAGEAGDTSPRRDRGDDERRRPAARPRRAPRRAPRGAEAEDESPRARLSQIARSGEELAQLGRPAPGFLLPLLDGSNPPAGIALDAKRRVSLDAWEGDRPVVLIFGSYT